MAKGNLVPAAHIEQLILLLRGHRVLLDLHLAPLYGVDVRVLNQAVSRNITRFPADFMFRLTREETANLKSQFVTSSAWGGRRKVPAAFTEQGRARLADRGKTVRYLELALA